MENKLNPQQVAQFLAQAAVFKGSPGEALAKLAPHMEQRLARAGETLVKPGSAAVSLGFIVQGRASLHMVSASGATDTTIEEIGAGECFGEIGLLLGGVNPLAVIAEEDCYTVHMVKAHFDQVVGALPAVGLALSRKMAQRVVKMSVLSARAKAPSTPPTPVAEAVAPPVQPSLKKGDVRFVETSEFQMNAAALELMPAKLIQLHRMLPLELRGRTLVVGMVNPKSLEARQDLRRTLATVDPEIVAISQDDFNQTLVRLKLDVSDRAAAAAQQRAGPVRPTYQVEVKKEADKAQIVIGDEVINLLDKILVEGVERGASDIHIESESSGVRVRYRIQGMLLERKEMVSVTFAQPLIARVKVLAEMDITERRLPQDGRIGAVLGKRELNFRISTLAAARGEKVVIRIIDPGAVMRPLEHIFLEPHVAEQIQVQLTTPHGALVVAGPTGSGKSSTLYSMLNTRKAARPDNNIVTVEDPVEFLFPGITQVPVNTRIGLDYPQVLRSLLRQDPDVIMIGELRDAATAAITIEAALTGHVVMTSTHASTAVSVLQRLGHLGIEPQLIAQGVNMIVVQRLARKLCPQCVRDDDVAPALLENLVTRHLIARGAVVRLPRPVGCDACDRSGYRGRVAVGELLVLTDELRHMYTMGAKTPELLGRAAQSGHFVPFSRYAAMLMARRMLSPADALLTVAG